MKSATRWRGTRASTTSASPAARRWAPLIQQVAAERHCPVTLELGGKSPQIIFADADLDAALPMVINAIVQNAGQTCSAGSRLLVDQAIYEPLLERLGKAFEKLRVGPAAMDLDVGPLIRPASSSASGTFCPTRTSPASRRWRQGQVVDEAPETGYYQAPDAAARRAGRRTGWRRRKCSVRCWPR